VTAFYLSEVVWPEDSEMTGRPLKFRLIAECASKTACDEQAERRAKSHVESGFDSSRDAWWGKTADRVHYYHQTTTRPGRLWNGMKPASKEIARPPARVDDEAPSSTTGEQAGEGPDDKPEDRESEDLPPLAGT
jgi:hypothetical protein